MLVRSVRRCSDVRHSRIAFTKVDDDALDNQPDRLNHPHIAEPPTVKATQPAAHDGQEEGRSGRWPGQ